LVGEKALKRKAVRQSSTQVRRDKRAADKAQKQSEQEPRFVDIDPWVVLLGQLMEVPEDEPAGRERDKGEWGRAGRSPATSMPISHASPRSRRNASGERKRA
jgi:hypothetical protein